jgi:predicted GNAT family acetyltransferase
MKHYGYRCSNPKSTVEQRSPASSEEAGDLGRQDFMIQIGLLQNERGISMTSKVTYKTDLKQVDWHAMKSTLASDDFDNGRSPAQLQASFENSYATAIAYADTQIIGTARVLSDGVCNAYIVDVWTLTPYRRQRVASTMMQLLLSRLEGQHVYLFTDDSVEFYQTLGFEVQAIGLGKVVGQWLENETNDRTD